ncbi:MAG: translation initiation factor IF-6 [Candidatus Aenigmatarchaeota archaeon]|nr:MAG: translation initiation factor IF-6 [Candidatus Aenigmarchaeota archaeon]
MTRIKKINFYGDPNIGLYGFASDKYVLIGNVVKDTSLGVLNVPAVKLTIADTDLVGIFATGNSNKIITSHIIENNEKEHIEKIADVLVLNTKFTAVGNLILLNDRGCIISPLLKKYKENIESFLSLPVSVSTIAGLNVVGSAAICNNRGCLVHPQTKESEIKIIESVLDVVVDVGTVNFGSPFVRSGIIVNKSGFLVGDRTSGPEAGRMDEVFGFI